MKNYLKNRQEFDRDVRYVIYQTFTNTAKLPSTFEIARHLQAAVSEVEKSLDRLAKAHHIALAPGSYSIWMAHPFSGIPTNFVAEIDGKKYWGN